MKKYCYIKICMNGKNKMFDNETINRILDNSNLKQTMFKTDFFDSYSFLGLFVKGIPNTKLSIFASRR